MSYSFQVFDHRVSIVRNAVMRDGICLRGCVKKRVARMFVFG